MSTRTRALIASVAGLAALLLGVLAGPAMAQAEGLEIRTIDAGTFPLVRAVVSGPAITGDPEQAFTIVEDGEELEADVVRLRTNELNVVVAVDVSGSMAGEPLAQAKSAVGSLLATLPPDVPVAVVSFGESATVQHTFSTDRASIQAAVDGLIAAGGTALFDGVKLGLAQLSARGGTGAMVVLADGADSASQTPVAEVVDRLDGGGVSASFVALQTPDQDLGAVEAMAEVSGGQVTTVDQASQLAEAFSEIGAGFGGLFELRWRSVSTGESGEVTISLADAPDVSATRTFEHDAVRQFVPDFADDPRTVGDSGLLSAGWVPVAAALGVSLGAFLLINAMRTSEGAVERRAERLQNKEAAKADRKRRVNGVQERLNDLSAQMLQKNNRGRSLDDQLDRAGLAMRSNEFVVVCAAIAVGALFLGVLLFGIPYFLLMAIPVAVGIPMFLKVKIGRRRKKFVNQLGDTLQLMAGSLTAGYGLGQTLDSVARETDSPTSEEFQRVVMETRLGRSLEDALDAMSHRIGAKDFDWVVDAIKIQSSVGGNLSEIIDQVGETIRARTRIKRQVDALTAEGKISALVLFVLPFGLFGFIFSSNPDYIKPMFSSGLGQVMLGAAALMMTAGGLWLKKLVNPEF
ncbi:MAG TPA: type II secretion system F family protein [Acidimicrobiales bacterium]|nr:type II secretion system F family protein [Acidimicrobiales bacterium]